jgi:hypothetical protein
MLLALLGECHEIVGKRKEFGRVTEFHKFPAACWNWRAFYAVGDGSSDAKKER